MGDAMKIKVLINKQLSIVLIPKFDSGDIQLEAKSNLRMNQAAMKMKTGTKTSSKVSSQAMIPR